MGIDPNFILWNYFFCVRRPQDLDAELTNFVVGACLLMLGPGMASILISTSASQINEGGGGRSGFTYGTRPLHRSPCSSITSPFPAYL
jgi:hypothetical protein